MQWFVAKLSMHTYHEDLKNGLEQYGIISVHALTVLTAKSGDLQ